jgi:hypothetical protein
MFSRRVHILLLVVALASAAAIAPGKASADRFTFGNFCTSVSPDASLTLGANTPAVEATSRGGSYFAYPCYRFVTDIYVPTTSSGGFGYLPAFDIGAGYSGIATGPGWGNLPLSQSDCEAYDSDLHVYRKNVRGLNSTFTFVGGGSFHGSWMTAGEAFGNTHYCQAVKDSGFVDLPSFFNPPTSTEAVYRVVFGAKVGTWKQVTVRASYLPLIT